jgi:hypothetical protein
MTRFFRGLCRVLLLLLLLVPQSSAKGADNEHTFRAHLRENFPFVECLTTTEVVYTRVASTAGNDSSSSETEFVSNATTTGEQQQWVVVSNGTTTTTATPTADEGDALFHPCPCTSPDTPLEVCPAHLPVCRFYQQGSNPGVRQVFCLRQTSSDAAVAQLFRWTFVGLTFVVVMLAACSQEGRWAGQYLQRRLGRHRPGENDDDDLHQQARAIMDGSSTLPAALVEEFQKRAARGALVAAAQEHTTVRLKVKTIQVLGAAADGKPPEAALPQHPHDIIDDDDNPQAPACAICLEAFRLGSVVGDIPCGHHFHKACLKEWIRHKHNNCPLCATAMVSLWPPQQQQQHA